MFLFVLFKAMLFVITSNGKEVSLLKFDACLPARAGVCIGVPLHLID
jgi:hypothetical protein